jgi:hypothetical protein
LKNIAVDGKILEILRLAADMLGEKRAVFILESLETERT